MSIVGLDHIQLAMPSGEEDAARRFYGGVLRFEEVRPDDVPFEGKRHCYIDDPFGNRIELIDASTSSA